MNIFKKTRSFLAKSILKSLLVSILLASIPLTTQCANIIFDLGGVLIGNNKSYVMRHVGFYSFFMYLIRFNNPFSLRSRLFSTLDDIPALTQNRFGATDENGKVLPNIMCDWMAGAKTCEEIKNDITKHLEQNPSIFYNYSEQRVINNIISFMFTPNLLVEATILLKDGFTFVKLCKKRGHNIFVLSNWDGESFEYLQKKHSKLFELFAPEHIVISGEIGFIKPDPDIYAYIIGKHNLDPRQCLFFDDQEINIKSAESLGINGVLCKNLSYKEMEHELKKFETQLKTQNLDTHNIDPANAISA